MFRYENYFRTVAFVAPKLRELRDLMSFFPVGTVTPAEQPTSAAEGFDVMHCFYYSPTLYTPKVMVKPKKPEEYQKRIRGKTYYRYNMYFLSSTYKKNTVFFIAVPLLRMALDIYPIIREAGRGTGIRFQLVELARLLNTIQEDKHMEGALSIKRARLTIRGDELTDSLVISGQDVPHSSMMRKVLPYMTEVGIATAPERLRLSYLGGSYRFTLDIDNVGHYRFWVGKTTNNLPALANIMSYLYENKLVIESASFPFMRLLMEEGEQGEEI